MFDLLDLGRFDINRVVELGVMVVMMIVMTATALNRLVYALAVLQLLDLIVVVIDSDDVTTATSRCLLNVIDARVALRV